jgi:uncharacterized repeat protein (TIGR01451 family)
VSQSSLSGRFNIFSPSGGSTSPLHISDTSKPIDWDADGDLNAPPYDVVSLNENNFGSTTSCTGDGQVLTGFNDWANLKYDFQNTVDFVDGVHLSTNEPDNHEITVEESDALVANTLPLITLSKTASAGSATVGSNVTYTLTATNQGPKQATNVSVVDSLPAGVSFVSARPSCSLAGSIVTCSAGTLDIGSTFTASVVVRVNRLSLGALTNHAAVTSDPENNLPNMQTTRFQSPVVMSPFFGFDPPIDNPPAVNQEHAGRTIPVKFSLGANFGPNVFVNGSPQSQQIDCAGLPGPAALIGKPAPIGLDLKDASNTFHFNWQTDSSWAGTCRQLSVQMNDGTQPHIAFFNFS